MAVRVLFVCLGNICRSPMAEAVFQHLVDQAGLSDEFEIDSAGTGGWHVGERAHSGTRSILRQHGIQYEGSARRVNERDFTHFDYMLAMDSENLGDLREMMPGNTTATIKRFLEFAPELNTRDVPDPYYEGNFEEVYTLVNAAAAGLLAHVRQEKGL